MMYASELWEWLFTIEPPFGFLLALPFLVAFAGLLSEWHRWRNRRRNDGVRPERLN